MYTPRKFRVTDSETIRSFVDQNGFGIVISTTEHGEIETTYTPMFLSADMESLFGHIAKANPQWKSWANRPKVRILFNGPHTYISPKDYLSKVNVPTWNYTSVSVDGKIEILTERKDQEWLIDSLVAQYESQSNNPWQLDKSSDKLMNLFDAIVCFRVEVKQIAAKFKLNQNKSTEDQEHVANRLKSSEREMDQEIAALIRMNLENSKR